MASGLHSTIHALSTRLHLRWVPKWYGAFSDPNGGFYERLGKGFKAVPTGSRRLVTQCRQLSIYSHAALVSGQKNYPHLEAQFGFIYEHYFNPVTGLWHFSLGDDGKVNDKTCDLYALSFVIFACSHYYRLSEDERAKDTARQVLHLIDTKFRLPVGFAEALDENGKILPKMRRQNPHMHLLEACLFAAETWNDPAYELMADEMTFLFQNYFYDARRVALIEFFEDDLTPHHEKGADLEPGHFFEWVWLLKKHGALKGDASLHDPFAVKLFEWANAHGWDTTYGGIYDVVAPDGTVKADTKRIWPFCEALKANALMLTLAPDRQAVKDRVSAMVDVFEDKYMQERGFWTEWLTRDLKPAADYMPGTTPYHVYFGIVETLEVLEKRGSHKSIGAGVDEKIYGLRRALSNIVQGARKALTS